jgi:hypothetical protein
MELPKHKAFTQFGFDLPQLTDLLSDSSRVVDCVAIDPEVSFEFTPVSRVDFLRAITSITG